MSLALEKGIRDLYIVGDSKLVISWLDGSLMNRYLNLNEAVSQALDLKSLSQHVFPSCAEGLNQTANGLSKQTCGRPVGTLMKTRFLDGILEGLPPWQITV
jgi:hypothetical protein